MGLGKCSQEPAGAIKGATIATSAASPRLTTFAQLSVFVDWLTLIERT
jgi:hypothetical protein